MLQLLATGATTALSGIAGTVGSDLSKIATNLFGGGARDAQRQVRVDWFVQAAIEGSVTAGRVIIAAPQNVGSNEAKQWQAGYTKAQAGNPTVMAQALSAGPYWDSSDNATSDKTRTLCLQELAQIGQSSPSVTLPTTTSSPIQQGIGNAIQQIGSSITTAAASGANPAGGYVTVPTNSNTLIVVGGILLLLLLHNEG